MDSTGTRGSSTGSAGELPRPGEILGGKYRIESAIGSGGMGVVMGAVDTSLGRSVAIKFLSPDRAARHGAVARFLREARAAASIQSENVVRVFEVGTLPNGAPFIVMEHLHGADLSKVLKQRGALPFEEACDLILQACEALGEAHARGIVHRDLKPQNLFLTHRPDGSSFLKILDFGISKGVDDGTPNLTSTDTVMGTPLYMSPEQVRSLKNVDSRTDIWALGSILFELLTMSPIYQAPSLSALCAMIAMDPPMRLRARRPEAPPELEAVILRCLHKDPAGRYRDVSALADALVPFASERGRLSAKRVSHVVGAGTGPAAFNSGPGASGPSAGALSQFPTAMSTANVLGPTVISGVGPTIVDPGRSFPPSMPNVSSIGPMGATDKGGTSGRTGALVAGLVVGLGVLGAVGAGGVWYFVTHKDPTSGAMKTGTADAGTPSATATPIAPAVVPSLSSTSTSVKPRPAPTGVKDAGAPLPPSPSKDGGAPGPSPAPDKDEQERTAALARQAEASCRNHTFQMTNARDDASRKRAATEAKTFMCRGLISSRCEREVCRNACMVLSDARCLQDIQYVIDHGPAPKY